MNLFMIFAPRSFRWSVSVAERLHSWDSNLHVSGIATGQRAIHRATISSLGSIGGSIDWLDPLEREWASRTEYRSTLDRFARLLGDGAIKRILMADRHLAAGFVSGGTFAPAWLSDRSKEDNLEFHRRYLAGLLTYCFERLEEERPSLVFNYALAGAPALALSEAARHIGIPAYSLSPARLADRFVLDDSPRSLHAPVRRAFQGDTDRELSSKMVVAARELLARFRLRPEAPAYIDSAHHRPTIGDVLKQAVRSSRSLVANALRRHSHSRNSWPRNALAEMRAVLRARHDTGRSGPFHNAVDLNSKYAYYPLHVDPEASTMVLSPMVTNQLAVVEALAKALPVGMDLVVKEHAPMVGRRPKGFYSALSAMPGVLLVSPYLDQFDLIRNSALTSTISGTAGLEAMILGRPVLLFGEAPYSVLEEGFVHGDDLSCLPDRVIEALEVPRVDEARLVRYVGCLLRESVAIPSTAIWQGRAGLESHELSRALDSLSDALGSLLAMSRAEP